MQEIKTLDLIDGMVTKYDVFDKNNKLLIASGNAINSRIRQLLKQNQIDSVVITRDSLECVSSLRSESTVASDLPANSKSPDTVIIQERLFKVAMMFEEYKTDPLMRELCRLAIKCVQEGLVRA